MGFNARSSRGSMAVSAFTVANIKPSLNIDSGQRFIFGLDEFPEPLGSFKLDNIFTPVVGTPSVTNFETRNKDLSGFRWIHTTNAGDTFGSYKLQSFVNAQNTGTDILLFNQDGTVTFTSTVNIPSFAITGNLDMNNHRIVNLSDPVNAQDATTKAYVDNSISSFALSTPITLTGAVTGINSISNPIFTTFASTIPVSGANQIFNFSFNSNVVYRLNNTLAATTGTPSTIALSLNNATNGGYRLLHTSTSTDPAGLGTLRLQALNSAGATADVFTASINTGNGIPDTLFNGTATFNNAVTIQNNQSLIVTGNSGVADYLVMNNTNLSSKTQLRINVTGLPVATFGYDAAASQVYIDSPFGVGSPFVIKFGGTTRFIMNNSTGNIGIGGSTSPNAALQFGNVITNRRLVLYDSNNTDHQYYGFGINGGILRYQVDQLISDHVFYAGSSSTTSNELFRIRGNGDSLTTGTIFGRRVSGLMTMQNNAIGTTVATGNIFVKVAGTTVASNLNGVSSPVSNRLTHTSTNTIIAYINVAFTASHNGGGGEETTFALYKNGAQLTNTLISNQQLTNLSTLSINTLVSMNTNDYIELWCTNPNSGRIITVKHLMFNYTTT